MVTNQLKNFHCLDQDHYGEDNDCTLTSLTAVTDFYLAHTKSVPEVYATIEKIARKYGYTGKKGTDPWFIRRIFNEVIRKYCFVPTAKTSAKYLKGVGFSYETICGQIDKCNPVIMNVCNAGKYHNHTITVIGYDTTNKTLLVSDNWSVRPQTLRWDDVGFICSINYWD